MRRSTPMPQSFVDVEVCSLFSIHFLNYCKARDVRSSKSLKRFLQQRHRISTSKLEPKLICSPLRQNNLLRSDHKSLFNDHHLPFVSLSSAYFKIVDLSFLCRRWLYPTHNLRESNGVPLALHLSHMPCRKEEEHHSQCYLVTLHQVRRTYVTFHTRMPTLSLPSP
jgi:hypothetical protein